MKKIILYILRGIGLGCVFFTFSGIIFDIIFKGSFLYRHWCIRMKNFLKGYKCSSIWELDW